MKNSRKPRRVAGISLAIAVAGAATAVPAEAQPSPSLNTPAADGSVAGTPAAAPKADPSDVKRIVATLQNGVGSLERVAGSVLTPHAGSGSANARYSSGGWTYTAVAHNPAADRLYAISTGEDGKPAGHLLRLLPKKEEVADLGALDLKGVDTKDVASAAFTPHGTLVLFSGSQIRTIDLSGDVMKERVEQITSVPVKSLKLTVEGNPGDVGLPSAWASLGENEHELYAVSTSPEGREYKWALDTTTGRIRVSQLQVAAGANPEDLGDLNYAYTKNRDTLVFADDEARTLEVRGDEVTATDVDGEIIDNLREIAYLRVGSPYKPVTQVDKPAPLPGSAPVSPTSKKTVPTFSVPTVVAPSSEPTASERALLGDAPEDQTGTPEQLADTRAVPTVTTTDAPAQDRTVKFTVADDAGHAKSGVAVEIDELGISTKTDKNGQASAEIPASAGDVTAYIDGQPSTVTAGEVSHRVTLFAGSDGEADALAADKDTEEPAAPVEVQLTVKLAGKGLADAEITSSDQNVTIIDPKTDASGVALIRVPATGSYPVKLKFGNIEKDIRVSASAPDRVIQLDQQTSSEANKPATGQTVEGKTIKVRVLTANGDPVQFAQVYNKGATEIETRTWGNPNDTSESAGLTDEDGYVAVYVAGPAYKTDELTLSVRTAPAGYKTASEKVSLTKDYIEIELPKSSTTTSTKSRPQEILDVIDEVQPLVAAIAGPAALGAGLSGRPATGTSTKSTSTTTTATTGVRSTNLNGTVVTGRSTAASTTAVKKVSSGGSASSGGSNGGSKSAKSTKSSSSTTKTTTRDGDLADTGTPMTTVITLGVLALLIGGAYIALGRRRDA